MPRTSNPLNKISEETIKRAKRKSNLLADSLRIQRELKGLSLREVIPALGINDASSLKRMEEGDYEMRMSTYFKYCEALGIEPISFFATTLAIK